MALWVRTEASARIGLGHFMRCYAIAEQARLDGHEVIFLTGELPQQALERLTSVGIAHVQVPHIAGSNEDRIYTRTRVPEGQVLLLDSYAFDAAYYEGLHASHFLAVMDDDACIAPLAAHVVINSALRAPQMGYKALAPDARLLLGPSYAPIRYEFRQKYPEPLHPHVCVIFGGSDPLNLTGRTGLHLLDILADVEVRLIAGPAHAHVDELRVLCDEHPRLKLFHNPGRLAEVLYGADMVITAAGTGLYEIAAMGLPALGLAVVDNQAGALKSSLFPILDARNGWPGDFDEKVRMVFRNPDIGKYAREYVDGLGCVRILQALSAAGACVS